MRKIIDVMNKTLSLDDIKEVENDSRTNPLFRYYSLRVASVSSLNWKGIIEISFKGLIMINGNSETGFQHINERHNYWSLWYYRNGNEFESQSKFPEDIAPIDFIKIANEIFCPENYVLKNEHKNADKFEKYVGDYTFKNGNTEIVNLILYKNSKIIHSLYPQSRKYNKRKNRIKFPFSRGGVKVESDAFYRVKEIHVPFFGKDNILKYVLLVEMFYDRDIEEWSILVIDQNGQYKYHYNYGSRKIVPFKGDTYARISFQFNELREIEDFIVKINKKENEENNDN